THRHAATTDHPLPDVARHVDQSPRIVRTPARRYRRTAAIASTRRRWYAIAVIGLLEATACPCRIQPLRIGGQAIGEAAEVAEPSCIRPGLVERNVAYRCVAQILIADRLGRALAGGTTKRVELADRYFRARHRIRPAAAHTGHHHHERPARGAELVDAELAAAREAGLGAWIGATRAGRLRRRIGGMARLRRHRSTRPWNRRGSSRQRTRLRHRRLCRLRGRWWRRRCGS